MPTEQTRKAERVLASLWQFGKLPMMPFEKEISDPAHFRTKTSGRPEDRDSATLPAWPSALTEGAEAPSLRQPLGLTPVPCKGGPPPRTGAQGHFGVVELASSDLKSSNPNPRAPLTPPMSTGNYPFPAASIILERRKAAIKKVVTSPGSFCQLAFPPVRRMVKKPPPSVMAHGMAF